MKRPFALVLLGVLGLAAGALAFPPVRSSLAKLSGMLAAPGQEAKAAPPLATDSKGRPRLADQFPDALEVPESVAKPFGLKVTQAIPPSVRRTLSLAGSLALDTNHLAHVHTRFAGEVVELGTIAEPGAATWAGKPNRRPIRFGDHVQKGQVLAVLWSSELGEKKSEYIDALSRLKLEQGTQSRLEELYRENAIAERNLREARRNVEAAEIAVARVERTLRAWRLSEEEISTIRAETEQGHKPQDAKDGPVERAWARVELKAPLEGIVLEKNLAVGDIVDTATDLFKIADMRQLSVWTYVYEEDLPALLKLPRPISWTIRLKSDLEATPLAGHVEKIGDIIDPTQHTALVMGQVDNPDRRMRAGQFITAQVDLPATPGEVEVPVPAVIDNGEECIVFVQPDPDRPVYAMRRVSLLRRSGGSAFVRSTDGPQSTASPLKAGDIVVTSGAIELQAALLQLQAAAAPLRQ